MDSPVGRHRGDAAYFSIALLIGLLAGTVGGYFHRTIDWLSQWPQWLAASVQGWQLVLAGACVTMVGTIVSLFLVRRFAPEAGGSGVQEIEGAMADKRVVRWHRVLPVKFFGGIISISSGLVLGREGPTIHIGASVAQGLSQFFRILPAERKGLLAAGGAAGLACAFNAPVASMIFVIEEMRAEFPYSVRNYMAVALACLASTVATEWIGGSAPDLSILYEGGRVALPWLAAFVPLGVILGGLGLALNAGLLRMADFSAACQARLPYVYAAVVGLVVGALIVSFPMFVTGGESLVREFGAAVPGLALLLLVVLVRFFMSIASYASGVPGGIFAPILALGMCTGLAAGTAVLWFFPEGSIHPVAMGIAAMGGLFAASVQAPTVGIILIAELTGTYDLLLPLAITCFAAHISARWMGARPIYELLLERTLRNAQAQESQQGITAAGTQSSGASAG